MKRRFALLLASTAVFGLSACSQDDVFPGQSLLDVKSVAPGEQCANGGFMIKNGVDINGNGVLDSVEVQSVTYTCNDAPVLDKKVVLTIWGAVSSGLGSPVKATIFPNFDINDYPGIKSIVFTSTVGIGSPTGAPGSAKVELYNMTDDEVIANAYIETTVDHTFLQSNDCYNSFPKKKFDLGIRVSGGATNYAGVDVINLILGR